MKNEINRRRFVKTAGFTGCALFLTSVFNPLNALNINPNKSEIPDPYKLNYCGYKCPGDCQMLKSTQDNDIKLKSEAYKSFKIKETYGEEFNEKNIFCWGCKTPGKPEGIIVSNCEVKKCVLGKGLNCCIECNALDNCEKEIWKKFPGHYKQVLEMQKILMKSKK